MSKLEKILGHNLYMYIKQHVKYIRDFLALLGKDKIEKCFKTVEIKTFYQKNKHVFFGYYDIQQINDKEDKLLVHVVEKKANTQKNKAEIGYYSLKDDNYYPLTSTSAWSWQQGSRLRWWPTNENYICFNDVKDDAYVCKVFDIRDKVVIKEICMPLYDIDSSCKYGLSLNFSRLQRLRPGYGYNTILDKTENCAAPASDGIFYVDIEKNTSRLLISLERLANDVSDPEASEHYINHISISPDGKSFMFFHIWTLKNSRRWKTRLCVMNIDEEKYVVLEGKDQVSHYDWIDNESILVTGYMPNRKQIYSVYNVIKNEKTILDFEYLNNDGHPTLLSDKSLFISDTYPKQLDMQTLFEYNIEKKLYRPIIKIYSTPLMYEEKRCDLHPRVCISEELISIDTTYKKNCRQVVLVKNWKDKRV